MGYTDPSSPDRRAFIPVTGIDWDDDASLRRWAYRAWQHITDDWGNDMTEAPSTVLTDRYTEAVGYATALHANQTRKGNTIAYACHLLGVSSLVIEAGGDEDQAIAGLLHDAAEDCGGEPRLVDIEARFGPRVERIVRGCSDSLTTDPAAKARWRDRKKAHLAHLAEADADVVIVTAADKLHNARAIWTDIQRDGIDTLTRFNANGHDIVWYYESMLKALWDKDAPTVLTIPLAETVAAIAHAVKAGSRRDPGSYLRSLRDQWIFGDRDTLFSTGMSRQPLDRHLSALQHEAQEVLFDQPQTLSWSRDAAAEILRSLPSTSAEILRGDGRWEVRVFDGPLSNLVVAFRSDGTWVTADQRISTWSSYLEGGPRTIGRSIASRFAKAHDLALRPILRDRENNP